MAEFIEDVKNGPLHSAYAKDAPFDKGKNALEAGGYRIISLEENAKLRIQEGKNALVSQNGNWTREGVLYIPKKGIFLTKKSSIMEEAEEATDCHRKGKEFCLNSKQVEKSLHGAVKLPGDSIPTDRFEENEVTNYAFGKTAKAYGEFLKDAGIIAMPISLASLGNKPYARQMWFRYLGGRSGFGGLNGGLYFSSGARGVREVKAGEASTKNLYSREQISQALKETNLSGIEKTLLEKLSK